MSDVMLDIETLSTTNNSVVLSLGAVKFNPFTLQDPYEDLELRITIDDQSEMGRDISEATLEWWGKQPADVQEAAFGTEGRISAVDACHALNKFLVGANKIWCQGPHFDICILESLFKDCKVSTNWKYFNIMDSRTAFTIHGDSREKGRGSLHNATEDSREQAKAVQKMFKQLGLTGYANSFRS